MNKCIISGNLVKSPELSSTPGGVDVCKFTVAVNRKFSKEKEVDFVNCVAWRQTAKLISDYMNKGSKGLFIGSLQIRDYNDKEGNKRYITEVIVEEVEFLNSVEKTEKTEKKGKQVVMEECPDEDLPF